MGQMVGGNRGAERTFRVDSCAEGHWLDMRAPGWTLSEPLQHSQGTPPPGANVKFPFYASEEKGSSLPFLGQMKLEGKISLCPGTPGYGVQGTRVFMRLEESFLLSCWRNWQQAHKKPRPAHALL